MSQLSACSTLSSIPDTYVDQDEEFIAELETVNEIYFLNIEENVDADVGDTDSSDSENEDEDNTDEVGGGDLDGEEQRDIDRMETDKVRKFMELGCGCSRLHGKPCSQVIDKERTIDHREQCSELTTDELDVAVKFQLAAHRKDLTHSSESRSKKRQLKDRERAHQDYFLFGVQVCRHSFMFAHNIGKYRLSAIANSLDQVGLRPRQHGNTGKAPLHALTMTDVEYIVNFLDVYAKANGLPLPGRLPNHRQQGGITLLPSDKSKADIHALYNEAAEGSGKRRVCLSEFQKIWRDHCPQIVISKPASDLCAKCQQFANKISNSGNMTEEEKAELLECYTVHVGKAKCQRDYYREKCEAAKVAYSEMSPDQKLRGRPPCSYSGIQQYSFDFAQQLFYPHYAQQVGPLFFKTPRKCQCFGVCAEGAGTQVFYLIDEAECVGKGANCVASLLNHHFDHQSFGEDHVQLQMDNCSGQNKNNTVLWYGLWRTMTGRHKTVEFALMEAGHTKFNPDWHFGVFKMKWRHSTVETLDDIAASVHLSSKNRHNIPQLVKDDEKPVIFYNWSEYLANFFKKIPSLKKYHHFSMSCDKPGVVSVKEYANTCTHDINILKTNSPVLVASQLPEVVEGKGLDSTRQWYLYDEISQFCLRDTSACPKPLLPKSSASVLSKNENGKRERVK